MDKDNAVGYLLSESATESSPEIKHVNDKFIRFNAILQEGDELNRNKRKYPTKILAEGLQDDYIKERIATDGWFGKILAELKLS